jgi:small nuclear ribonucleoprotein (snRNP)-like protein
MGLFTEIRNPALIRELTRELNTDIVLFGFDGFAFFGNLQAVEDCRIAILSPAIEADSNDVEILTPGGEVLHVDFTRVDLWNIVAKGTAIVSDPIERLNCHNESGARTSDTSARNAFEEGTERQESHHLIRVLCRMVGDSVVITTLGGFSIEGTLIAIDDELAILSNTDIFVPGSSTSISDRKIRSAVVNLEALTSVSGVCCC